MVQEKGGSVLDPSLLLLPDGLLTSLPDGVKGAFPKQTPSCSRIGLHLPNS